MKLCKCDRCGAIFTPYEKGEEFYNRSIQVCEEIFSLTDIIGDVDESYDICDKCYESFSRWLRRGVLEGHNNGIRNSNFNNRS